MSIYDQMTTQNALPKGDHLARIESVDMKVAKTSGKEYLSFKLKLKSGETLFHALYFSEKAIGMAIKQLKNLGILGSLPIYASVSDLNADVDNFIRKVQELLMQMEKKKITITCSGYDDQDRPKLWIKEYSDVPNAAIQKEVKRDEPKAESFDTNDEIPF